MFPELDVKFYKVQNSFAALFILAGHMLSIVATPFFFLSLFNNINFYTFPIYIFCVLFVGSRMRALGNIMHECTHNSYAKNKKLNLLIGHFIAILEFSSFTKYKKSHMKHHKNLGEQDHDEDFKNYLWYIRGHRNNKILNNKPLLFTLIVFNPINWLYNFSTSFAIKDDKKIAEYLKLIYLISICMFCYFFSPKKIILFIIIPYFTSYQVFKIASDFLDHYQIYFNMNKFCKTTNHIFRLSILNLIIFPRNDAYHLIHHIYPKAPNQHFKKIHAFLSENCKIYRERKHYL